MAQWGEPVGRILNANGARVQFRVARGGSARSAGYPVETRVDMHGSYRAETATHVLSGQRFMNEGLLFVGDKLFTGGNTLLTLEWLIGGRATLGQGATVEIVDERHMATIGSTKELSGAGWTEQGMKVTGGLGIRG